MSAETRTLTARDFGKLFQGIARWRDHQWPADQWRAADGDDEPVRWGFDVAYWVVDYAHVLFMRQFLEQRGHPYQVLINDHDDGEPYAVITDYDTEPAW